MCEILYAEAEGSIWKLGRFPYWTEKGIKKLCEYQSKHCIDPHHKIFLPNDMRVAAVLFHDGLIWDAILSAYDSSKRSNRLKRRLPKCMPKAFNSVDHKYC